MKAAAHTHFAARGISGATLGSRPLENKVFFMLIMMIVMIIIMLLPFFVTMLLPTLQAP
jgi:hypothetical protein